MKFIFIIISICFPLISLAQDSIVDMEKELSIRMADINTRIYKSLIILTDFHFIIPIDAIYNSTSISITPKMCSSVDLNYSFIINKHTIFGLGLSYATYGSNYNITNNYSTGTILDSKSVSNTYYYDLSVDFVKFPICLKLITNNTKRLMAFIDLGLNYGILFNQRVYSNIENTSRPVKINHQDLSFTIAPGMMFSFSKQFYVKTYGYLENGASDIENKPGFGVSPAEPSKHHELGFGTSFAYRFYR